MRYFAIVLLFLNSWSFAADISFTVDDPEVSESPVLSVSERYEKIIGAFNKHNVKGALFVCGKRIDNTSGKSLLQRWDMEEHLIANHSYSHLYYNASKTTFEAYRDDFLKVESLLVGLKNFAKIYRFPFLKEGDTRDKIDLMRKELQRQGYKQGYVTIDASDWYVDSRLRARLSKDPQVNLKPYLDFYLQHMWNRAVYYDDLAKKVFKRDIKHTMLIHHNLLNALFLDELIQMFKNKTWNIISARAAFADPVFSLEPTNVPAGESIVWAAAKATGKYDAILRYPAEDGEYEKAEMDRLGL